MKIRNCFWMAAAVCLTFAAGCNQTPTNAGASSVDGAYTLVSVDGKTVPCTVEHGGRAVTVKSGQFQIKGGKSACTTIFSLPNGKDVTREVEGSFNLEGSVATMKWKGAGSTTGTCEGSNFKMNNEGMVFAYRK